MSLGVVTGQFLCTPHTRTRVVRNSRLIFSPGGLRRREGYCCVLQYPRNKRQEKDGREIYEMMTPGSVGSSRLLLNSPTYTNPITDHSGTLCRLLLP